METRAPAWDESETRLDRVLESVVERARSLVNARTVMVLLEDRGLLIVAATTGEFEVERRGVRLQADSAAWRTVLAEGKVERVSKIGGWLAVSLDELGIRGTSALLLPLTYRERSVGILAAIDRIQDGPEFTAEDESLLMGFAASASMALGAAQSMAEARLRESIEVAERERARWARELHDETLQSLGALRVRLSASLRLGHAEMAHAIATAITQIEDEIANLRSLITELRPAALDELGLGAAIEGLADNHAAASGLEVKVDIDLGRGEGGSSTRLERELESNVYRLVQEALTNVSKHAQAETVWVEVGLDEDTIEIRVRDDGVGFDMDARSSGFGLVGMRERVALAGGSLTIVSTPGVGTELRGRIPLERPARGLRRAGEEPY
jgi:signal transduction histidine kinase